MRNPNTICSIPGCGKPKDSYGYCSGHAHRLRRHGDPLKGGPNIGIPLEYLMSVLLIEDTDDCQIWPYARMQNGYGRVNRNGRQHLVHRVVCEITNGPAPTSLHEAAHTCGNGAGGCANKRHLVWKTHAENMEDKIFHDTHARGERNWLSKLSEADVFQIRALRGVETEKVLAKRFNVTRGTISSVMRRKSWAWLDEGALGGGRTIQVERV